MTRGLMLTVLLTTLFLTGNIQAQKTWCSYSHVITEQGYAGLKFRYRAFVRTKLEDADASASLWIRVDRNGEKGFLKNLDDMPIVNSDWKEYAIDGTFSADYKQIAFGVSVKYNGDFYLDDVRLEVQSKDKKWKTVYQTDFEKVNNGWLQGNGAGSGTNILFKAEVSNIKPKSGKQSFLIHGETVPNFGTNAKAGKYANVNDINLYYEIYGEGHPLVVLHGNGGSIKDAASHYPELIKKYKVIAVDSRGQGKSTDSNAPLNYDILADDVNALLNELKIDSAFIWGQSDGAIVGLILAMNHPEKVEKLLAFGANIQPDTSAIFSWGINAIAKAEKESTEVKDKKLMRLMLNYPNIPFSDLSKIKAPVLIMTGDRDFIRPEHTLKLFQNIPKSQLCILPGSTHGASNEKKDLFLQLLYNFFDKPFTMPATEDWFK